MDFGISTAKEKARYPRVARCLSDARRKMDEFLAMLGEKRRNMLDNYHSRSMKVTRAATKRCTYVGIIGPRHATLKSYYTVGAARAFVNAARSSRCLTR